MLSFAEIFTTNMVLQRRKPVPVWGTAEAGKQITVTVGSETYRTTADISGKWCVELNPREAGGSYSLELSDGTELIRLEDILFGDVFLAGGQSNMEFPLCDSRGARRAVSESDLPSVQFCRIPHRALPEDAPDIPAHWEKCSPETSGSHSAIAYWFARRISESQGVPVGIVECCWGGTSVACWMSVERLKRMQVGTRILYDFDATVGDKSEADYHAELAGYWKRYDAWFADVEAYRGEHPHAAQEEIHRACGYCPWPQPLGHSSPFRPGGLYATMVEKLFPLALRGVLFYQGESDGIRCRDYAELLSAMIGEWREGFRDDELPFLLCQLPMYCEASDYAAQKDDKSWAILREQQEKVSRTVANVGLIVLLDCGEFDNIHPAEKQLPGERLARKARQMLYGEDIPADGPVLRSARRYADSLELRFFHTAGSLELRDVSAGSFELAGTDGVYCPASVRVSGDTLILTCAQVSEPITVRYAWQNYGMVCLYDAVGLPARPFRTDWQKI